MQFRMLKRNHKRKIIIGGLILICVISTITITTRAKYKILENKELVKGTINYKPYDFKIMAMYKSEDGANYTEINEMPKGYIINEERTYCTIDNKNQVKGKIKNINGEYIIEKLKKSDKCYIYFDKINISNAKDIIANNKININSPDFSKIATEEEGIYQASDGMYGGTSYYWRGAATANHIIFANKCWRIIRINVDGSVRLIYNGSIKSDSTCTGNGSNYDAVINLESNSEIYYATSDGKYNNPSYVGWTYVEGKQRPEEGDTPIDSNAKIKTEEWYNSNIGNNTEYSSKVADGLYCNDRNVGDSTLSDWKDYTTIWNATGPRFIYAPLERHTNHTPSLACNRKDIYSLKVGTLTLDEGLLAGGNFELNYSYYLNIGKHYWTMSPYYWNESGARASMFSLNESGRID